MFFLIKLLYFSKFSLATSNSKPKCIVVYSTCVCPAWIQPIFFFFFGFSQFKVHLSPKFDYLEAFHAYTLEGLDKGLFT